MTEEQLREKLLKSNEKNKLLKQSIKEAKNWKDEIIKQIEEEEE